MVKFKLRTLPYAKNTGKTFLCTAVFWSPCVPFIRFFEMLRENRNSMLTIESSTLDPSGGRKSQTRLAGFLSAFRKETEAVHLFHRTNWLLESPSRYVQEFKLPQIPPWSRVYDNPINEDNDDPITLQETAGSLFIYSVGIGFSCLFFCLECLFYYIEARRKGEAVSFQFSSVWRLLTA